MFKLAIPVLLHKDYSIYFDYTSYGIVAHIDYHNWNKEVYKTSIPEIKKLARKQTKPIYVEIYDSNDKKHLKFIKLCGFEPSEFITEEGNEMYVWRDK